MTEPTPGRAARPAFGDNPDVDIVRIAAASSMRRLGEERDAAMAETRRLRAVLGEIFTCAATGDPALFDDDQLAEWRQRAGLDG
jgi:preprotein translocase subunit SecA